VTRTFTTADDSPSDPNPDNNSASVNVAFPDPAALDGPFIIPTT